MTLVSEAQMLSALEAVAEAAGLDVGPTMDGDEVAGLVGPFVTRDVTGPEGGLAVCIAVRDTLEEGVTDLCEALTAATTEGDPGTEGEPVASGADLVARFLSPVEAVALVAGDDVVALVLRAVERRSGAGAGTARPQVAPGTARALGGFDKLVNVALDVSVELGRTRVALSEVLEYDVGSVVELDRAAGAPVDIRVNGTLLAHGEVVLIDDEYAVRITAIVEPGTAL